jgi:hypothetical protein
MTISELEDKLPNGFHDSFLVSLTANFAAGTACVELDVDDDDPDPEVFRRVTPRLKAYRFSSWINRMSGTHFLSGEQYGSADMKPMRK